MIIKYLRSKEGFMRQAKCVF